MSIGCDAVPGGLEGPEAAEPWTREPQFVVEPFGFVAADVDSVEAT